MVSEWERRAKIKLLERGIRFCSSYLKDLPLEELEQAEIYKKCLDNWLAMPPSKRIEIQGMCSSENDRDKCVGFRILNSETDSTPPFDVEATAKCEIGALFAPDPTVAQQFKQWCFNLIPSPQKTWIIDPDPLQSLNQLSEEGIRVGFLEIPIRIIDKMSRVLVDVEYGDFPVQDASKYSYLTQLPTSKRLAMFNDPSARRLRLPLEKGFLILADSEGDLKTSKIITGEPCYTEPITCIRKAQDEGFKIVGVFHIHPHPTHSSIPGIEDFEAARHLSETICPYLKLLAVGGFMRNRPVINFFLKRPEFEWVDFTTSPVLYLFNQLFPEPILRYFIRLETGEVERFNIYDNVGNFPTDILKKILCAKYFIIDTIDVQSGQSTNDITEPPSEICQVLKNLMLENLSPLPIPVSRNLKFRIQNSDMECRLKELLSLFQNEFLKYYGNCTLQIPSHIRFNASRPREYSQLLGQAKVVGGRVE